VIIIGVVREGNH